MTTPLQEIATAIGGAVHGDQIATPTGRVYVNFMGRVKLERYGKPVVELGAWDDVPAVLAAYHLAVSR